MISVILPVYNVEKYIKDCITSLLKQTCRDFEIIVVDDGTKDRSSIIAAEVLEPSGFPYRIIHTENRGVSAARNTGLREARGEYAVMVDSDDVLLPDFIRDFIELTEKHPKADVLFCGYQTSTEGSMVAAEAPCEEQCLSNQAAQTAFLNRKIRFLLPAMLLKTEYVHRNQIFLDEAVRYSEDVQYIWRALVFTQEDVVYFPRKNYYYVLHDSSTMTSSGIPKILTGCGGIQRLYDEIGGLLTEPARSQIVAKWMFAMLHGASKMLDFESFFELYRTSQSEKYLPSLSKTGDAKTKAVVSVLQRNKKAGYRLMRRF